MKPLLILVLLSSACAGLSAAAPAPALPAAHVAPAPASSKPTPAVTAAAADNVVCAVLAEVDPGSCDPKVHAAGPDVIDIAIWHPSTGGSKICRTVYSIDAFTPNTGASVVRCSSLKLSPAEEKANAEAAATAAAEAKLKTKIEADKAAHKPK